MVLFRFVMPVTTASGKVMGGEGVALGVAVADGSGVGVGSADGDPLGLGDPHAARSINTRPTATPRTAAGVFTAVS
jgi:hypothetical protein